MRRCRSRSGRSATHHPRRPRAGAQSRLRGQWFGARRAVRPAIGSRGQLRLPRQRRLHWLCLVPVAPRRIPQVRPRDDLDVGLPIGDQRRGRDHRSCRPGVLQQGDAEREIQRLSRDFGQQARVIAADLPSGGRAVIAVWGAVNLTTLDSPTLDALRRGAPVHSGLLVGVLGDPRASARLGLPVYSLGGGAGFIWNAEYNSSGKGVLRIIAVDPSALNSAPQPQPVAPAPSPATVCRRSPPEPPAIARSEPRRRGAPRTRTRRPPRKGRRRRQEATGRCRAIHQGGPAKP